MAPLNELPVAGTEAAAAVVTAVAAAVATARVALRLP